MNFFRKVGVVAALVMAFSATAWANSAYTVVDPAYSKGKVGTIVSGDGRVNPNATGELKGAPAVHSFTDANGQPRVLAYNYNCGTGNPEVVIYNPTTTPWTPIKTIADLDGADIVNLYGITTLGNSLYAVDYDTAKIVKINMASNDYSVTATYTFQGTTPGYDKHGMAITTVGNDIYALFTEVKDPYGNAQYLPSKVVKLNKDTLTPMAAPAQVGKNAFTLKPFNNKLYVASIGGKQNANAYNSGESKLDVVNLANMSVITAFSAGTAIPYDFRDITFSSTGDAYILVGKFTANWTTMEGKVYKTTAAGIDRKQIGGNPIESFNVPGYFWALHYESATDRLWFAKGNQIDLHMGSNYSPIGQPMMAKNDPNYPNLNSLTLIGQGVTLQGYQDPARVIGHSNVKSMRKVKNTK